MSTLIATREEVCFTMPPDAWTLDGFCRWAMSDEFPQTGRISYIDGQVVIDMSPERVEFHARVKHEISRTVGNVVEEFDLGVFYPDGTGYKNAAANLYTEPDGMFASWETLKSGKLKHVGRIDDAMIMEGTADWVLEIISPTSVKKDTTYLREAYHKAGVPEYWCLDARCEPLDFKMLIHRPAGYEEVNPADGWYSSPVFGRSLKLDRSRDPIGLWRYRLQYK